MGSAGDHQASKGTFATLWEFLPIGGVIWITLLDGSSSITGAGIALMCAVVFGSWLYVRSEMDDFQAPEGTSLQVSFIATMLALLKAAGTVAAGSNAEVNVIILAATMGLWGQTSMKWKNYVDNAVVPGSGQVVSSSASVSLLLFQAVSFVAFVGGILFLAKTQFQQGRNTLSLAGFLMPMISMSLLAVIMAIGLSGHLDKGKDGWSIRWAPHVGTWAWYLVAAIASFNSTQATAGAFLQVILGIAALGIVGKFGAKIIQG